MAERESEELALVRRDKLYILQKHYAQFYTFLVDAMDELGFGVTAIQADIADFLEYGPSYKMVQAQRGQAKSTITAIYAVWRLIHNPRLRVLILSAGGDLASDIARLCSRLIESMVVLECMRPDKAAGDQTSIEGYDVHHSLKGIDKSASITSIGITGNLQGKRADLLIADDIESTKNSMTALMRERLLHLTRDFTSINQTGDIVYLGTPQSIDSIYGSLPGRGFVIRIWPGRYPNEDQRAKYGNMLAPIILRAVLENPGLGKGGGALGKDGQATDPDLLNDEFLIKKEIDQGRSYFTLQHMLLTDLSDEDKFPLKLKDLIFAPLSSTHATPDLVWMPAAQNLIPAPSESAVFGKPLYLGQLLQEVYGVKEYESKIMFLDPAGGGLNGDETGWCVLGFLAGYLYVIDAGGEKGGYDTDTLDRLAKKAVQHQVDTVVIEPNFGVGAFKNILLPVLRKLTTAPEYKGKLIGAEDGEWASTQKEKRICDTLEPVISSHRLVVNQDLIADDVKSVSHYPMDKRRVYQLLFQLAHLTRDAGSLLKDDRVDALAGAVAFYADSLARDARAEAEKKAEDIAANWMKDPLGRGIKQKQHAGIAPAVLRLQRRR